MRPVLEALQVLSDAGLVHRDVKPDNILMFEGQPRLGDISLLRGDNACLTPRGTPGYLTPSWYGSGHPDMFGAAATLYTLLTGNLPDRMGRSAFNGPPQGEASLSAEEQTRRRQFHAVIRRALDERPAERYRDFTAMAHALAGKPQSPSRKQLSASVFAGMLLIPFAVWMAGGLFKDFLRTAPNSPTAADEFQGRQDGIEVTQSFHTVGRAPAVDGEASAAKGSQFVNSLGMTFVPVPGTNVLFCIHETRWRDYAEYFKAAPGLDAKWIEQYYDGVHPTERSADHPVAYVSWDDAAAFCTWLSRREQKTYRLPTDREWSIAAGLKENRVEGDTPESVLKNQIHFPWGPAWPPSEGAGNYSDQSRRKYTRTPRPDAVYIDAYDDGFPATAPAMSFAPNHLGLFDMGGNVAEWVVDRWNSAKPDRVLRGSSWAGGEFRLLLSSARLNNLPGTRWSMYGFRVVLVPPASQPKGQNVTP